MNDIGSGLLQGLVILIIIAFTLGLGGHFIYTRMTNTHTYDYKYKKKLIPKLHIVSDGVKSDTTYIYTLH